MFRPSFLSRQISSAAVFTDAAIEKEVNAAGRDAPLLRKEGGVNGAWPSS